MPMYHIIKEDTTKKPNVLNITVASTAEVSMSQTTHEGQTPSFNQSALLSGHGNGTTDSSFPVAAVIVAMLVLVGIAAFLWLGYIFRKRIKDWIGRRFVKPRADIEMTTRSEQTVETADQEPRADIELTTMTVETTDQSDRDPDVSSTDPANTSSAALLGPGNGDV